MGAGNATRAIATRHGESAGNAGVPGRDSVTIEPPPRGHDQARNRGEQGRSVRAHRDLALYPSMTRCGGGALMLVHNHNRTTTLVAAVSADSAIHGCIHKGQESVGEDVENYRIGRDA